MKPLLIFAALIVPAFAASPAFVKMVCVDQAYQSTVTTCTGTVTNANDLIIVHAGAGDTAPAVTSVSDGANSYTAASGAACSSPSNILRYEQWHGYAAGSGSRTFTVNWASAPIDYGKILVEEYSGAATSGVQDTGSASHLCWGGDTTADGYSMSLIYTPALGNITTTGANEMVACGMFVDNSGETLTVGSGFSNFVGSNSSWTIEGEDQAVASAGTVAASMGKASWYGWAAGCVSYNSLSTADYSMAGPTSGYVGVVSGTFTLTKTTSNWASDPKTITISDGGNAGTVTLGTCTGSGGGTTPAALSLTGGTTCTFTYTAAVAAALTLTSTINLGTDPSPNTHAYTSSAAPAPTCNAGTMQSILQGATVSLDGSGSSSPVSALTYAWSKTLGPSVTITNPTTATPTVASMPAGSYTFQLTVTDTVPQSSVCSVSIGAVAVDAYGVVLGVPAAVTAMLGPLIRYGSNPWPWFDDRHKAVADVQIANMDPYYGAWWDVTDAGTISVVSGSTTVTGIGTHFLSTICNGSGVPQYSIVIQYRNADLAGDTGRLMASVTSCASDTSLTLSGNWTSLIGSQSGLSWGDNSAYGTWAYNAAPANYYDNVAAFYVLYYRTGIIDYLNAARKLADRFWECPEIDRGNSWLVDPVSGSTIGAVFPNRSMSMLGLVLRALDGRPEMFAGLEHIWQYQLTYEFGANSEEAEYLPAVWDVRETAYELAQLSYCALYDTSSMKASCQAKLSTIIPGYFATSKAADGGWEDLHADYYSWTATPTTASVTHGSTAVVGSGTSWDCSKFPTSQTMAAMWFLNSSSRPNSNADGDPVAYTPTCTDGQHLTLDRPYAGTTGAHGWVISSPSYDTPFIGYGSYVYMQGLMAMAFDYAAKALAISDPTNSALARSYNLSAANWMKTYGYWAAQKSVYYGAQYVNCQAPILDAAWNPCEGATSSPAFSGSGARVISAEPIRGLMAAYAYSKDASLGAFIDVLYNAMWAKPTTCAVGSTVCVSDGTYLDQFDPGGIDISGTPPTGAAPKWFGQMWGISSLSAWPAIRINGCICATVGGARVVMGPGVR